ncbi:MAG: hypothetical protein ACE5JL_02675 [Dehalococcoidia bacterium]
MIEVTEEAKAYLLYSMKPDDVGPEKGLRLIERRDRFELKVDSPTEADQVIRKDDETVLIIDQATQENVGDVVIDLIEGPQGRPQLRIRPS